MTSRTKHSPASVRPVTILPPGRHMRAPSPLPASTVFGQCTHWSQVAGCMAAISQGQGQAEARLPRPAFQGHALGLPGHVLPGCTIGRPEAAKMGSCAGNDDHGHDEVAGSGAADGHIQVLHVRRIAR